MDSIFIFAKYFGSFVILVLIIVTIHEFGHYAAARMCKLTPEKFSIGFGPKVCGFMNAGTHWQISLLPLGGYVVIKEMEDKYFHPKKKLFIAMAGPLANIGSAVLAFFILFTFQGVFSNQPVSILNIEYDSEYLGATLQAGDKLLSPDGKYSSTYLLYINQYVFKDDGDTNKQLLIERNGKLSTISTNTATIKEIDLTVPREKFKIFTAIKLAIDKVAYITIYGIPVFFKALFMFDIKDLGGPLMIAKTSYDYMANGLYSFINLIGMISVSIAILNLMPLGILDGYHILAALYSMITNKIIPQAVEMVFMYGGVVIIGILLISVIYKDIMSFI